MTDTSTEVERAGRSIATTDVAQKRRDNLAKARATKAAKAAKAAKVQPPFPAPTPAAAPVDEFEGLSATDCCDACHEQYCVITGRMTGKNLDGTTFVSAHCGHPNKGGIQSAHQMNHDIKKRYLRAKRLLKAVALASKPE